jgi:hypothetical protein
VIGPFVVILPNIVGFTRKVIILSYVPQFQDGQAEKNLQFLHAEAKERLKHTLECSDALDTKALTLLSVLITLITGLAGVLAVTFDKDNFLSIDWPIRVSIFVLMLFLYHALMHLQENIQPMKYHKMGRSPTKALLEYSAKQTLPHLLYKETESYEERICLNDNANDDKAKNIETCVTAVFFAFKAALLALILAYWIHVSVQVSHS